jgi:hypothetical protein
MSAKALFTTTFEGLPKNDAALVILEAHTLRGTARQICAQQMNDILYSIEIAGKEEGFGQSADAYGNIGTGS